MSGGYYIGLMSGTSMDGIDAALIKLSKDQIELVATHSHDIPSELLTDLKQLCQPSNNEIALMGKTDRKLGKVFAQAVHELLSVSSLTRDDITAIGSHGQTIRHMPDGELGFSYQIGDANTIAMETGINVVADFRRKDIALGGQGAPLVPAFHQYLFRSDHRDRAIVNIGGISNITFLPKKHENKIVGFDTGPGNCLLDAWCMKHTQKAFDEDGQWSSTGNANPQLLHNLLSFDYFKRQPPKSTGRETFNLQWLESHLAVFPEKLSPEDVQATLVQLTALSIADQINHLSESPEVFLCGGGARNLQLRKHLKALLGENNLHNTDALGIAAEWVEAMAFAWLAYRYVNGKPGNLPSVTGASRTSVLGCLYLAK